MGVWAIYDCIPVYRVNWRYHSVYSYPAFVKLSIYNPCSHYWITIVSVHGLSISDPLTLWYCYKPLIWVFDIRVWSDDNTLMLLLWNFPFIINYHIIELSVHVSIADPLTPYSIAINLRYGCSICVCGQMALFTIVHDSRYRLYRMRCCCGSCPFIIHMINPPGASTTSEH
jgi:hypothetical protein